MICHLIGLNHGYQLRGYSHKDWAAFDRYLFSFCQAEKIDVVAEELSEEATRLFRDEGAIGSVAKDIARRLGITHALCDPDSQERSRVGISSGEEAWPQRERCWLQKLRGIGFTRCAFVLGSRHVASFAKLLTSEGIDVRIEYQNWEP